MQAGAQRFIKAVNQFLFVQDAPEPADVFFLPGSAEAEHALHAAALYRAGYAPYVLPSGRFAKPLGHLAEIPEALHRAYPGAYDTEWALMQRILVANGVPEAAILREDQATYTWENAQFSRRVTDALGLSIRTALLCCKPCHARRALLYYQAAFPDTRMLVCPASEPGFMAEDWFLTEAGRRRILGEVQRLGGQIGDVFADMLAAP